jgi:hypothetical protein
MVSLMLLSEPPVLLFSADSMIHPSWPASDLSVMVWGTGVRVGVRVDVLVEVRVSVWVGVGVLLGVDVAVGV